MPTHSPAAAGPLLEVDNRRRVTLGRLATHDRYTARVMVNGSILLEPAIVISADEAAVLHDPEFIAMIKQRVVDMQNGAGDILTQEEIRAQLAALDDVDDD